MSSLMMQRSLTYIEDNLIADIGIDDMARQASCSQSHFSRLFKQSTGFTVMDYLRKRRLSLALVDMLKNDRRVIDLALDYGFSYEQSFIRAFKKEFAFTPTRIEKIKTAVSLTLDVSRESLQDQAALSDDFSIAVQFLPELHFCGVNYAAWHPDSEELSQDKVLFFTKYVSPKISSGQDQQTVYTIDGFLPNQKNYLYFMGLRSSLQDKAIIGLDRISVPAGIYYHYQIAFCLKQGITIEQEKKLIMADFYQNIIKRNRVSFGRFFFYTTQLQGGKGQMSIYYQLEHIQ